MEFLWQLQAACWARQGHQQPPHAGSAPISWHLQHRGLVFSICFTLEGFPSTCDGVIISASRPGKAGMIQEQAAADGWDPAVPWDSWWFGISGCGIPAPIHHHSTFPEKEMCPVVGTSSSEGVLQIMRRGN